MLDRSEEKKLARTLGLPAALSVGIGTMLGAGIFVFPGLAANDAGPAAVLSFAIGGLIALLVAFADYFLSLFDSFSEATTIAYVVIACGTAAVLTLINSVGSSESGRLQFSIVVVLFVSLAVVFGYGLLQTSGISGDKKPLPEFAPFGAMPIFTTAAFVFTSFLGFVQISTIAGEVKSPRRNLPAALIGNVVIVTLLYVVALSVTTSLLSGETLADTGTKATIALGELLFGQAGRMLVLFAGLFATLSSANASILSSSRTLFALGRDRLVPAWSARISERF